MEWDDRRGDRLPEVEERPVTPKLDSWATVVDVDVVVVGADAAGVTSIVELVVGDGMTTPDDGSETTPRFELSVGPLAGLRGTKTTPRIPAAINARETTHHNFCERPFSFGDFT